jgi:thiol-disulfide isomerase/thioredoxin
MKSFIILFLCSICVITASDAQTNSGKTTFTIEGKLGYRDTGSIAVWYRDAGNKFHRDTVTLNQGRFGLSGTVSGATEMMIWTNPRNIDFDDPSVVRFIPGPGLIEINKPNELLQPTISGSYAQTEMEQWDNVKLPLTTVVDRNYAIADSLRKAHKRTGSPLYKNALDSVYHLIDSLREISFKMDVGYIKKHPASFVSMFLLARRCRRLPLDSVVQLYSGFPDSIRNSSLAYDVLLHAYPLTDNKKFREENPLYGTAFNKRLNKINSMHDFRLQDVFGKQLNFETFKGKYLVVDVWASWCQPCIANIPAWNDLMKEYDPKLIQFISVSLDDYAANWKKAVEKHKPAGIQVLDSNALAGLFAVYSKVTYLPKYLIVDPAGKIINYDAPHPWEAQFRSILNGLVKK